MHWCLGDMLHWWLWAEANRKLLVESLHFDAKMLKPSVPSGFTIWFVKSNYSIYFFLLLAVRPAQTHPGPYGPGCVVLLSFCISGRKARNAYTSQGVSPEMRVLFFWPTFLFKKKSWYTKLWNPAESWISQVFTPKLRFGVKMKSFHCKFTVRCKHLTVLHWLRQCRKFAMEVSQ